MWRRVTQGLVIVLGVIALLMGGAYGYFGYAPALDPPPLSGAVQRSTIRVGHLDRTYAYYVPAELPRHAPLLFVLHGATQTAEDIRLFTGYEFERLADAHQFAIVYPDGYEKNWNDCRKAASYPARALGVDDAGLIQALVARFQQAFGVDTTRVFAAGYSNGGHLAYRLALERAPALEAVAIIAANLPAAGNSDCREARQPVPVVIINGTADPINPYDGGEVSLFGFASRGTVRSSIETARYFARLGGHTDPPEEHGGPIRRHVWEKEGRPDVVLYSLAGGGHVVPQPVFRAPRILGETRHDFNGPAEIWSFFARQD